jgi:hypothetical protein
MRLTVSARRAAVLLAVAALAGCGEEDPPLDFACTSGAEAVERALEAAPGDVRLAGGVQLSTCVRNARSDAELQNVGAVLTGAAEHLEEAAPRDARAALQLGFLIGAARRGAASSGRARSTGRRRRRRRR